MTDPRSIAAKLTDAQKRFIREPLPHLTQRGAEEIRGWHADVLTGPEWRMADRLMKMELLHRTFILGIGSPYQLTELGLQVRQILQEDGQ